MKIKAEALLHSYGWSLRKGHFTRESSDTSALVTNI